MTLKIYNLFRPLVDHFIVKTMKIVSDFRGWAGSEDKSG